MHINRFTYARGRAGWKPRRLRAAAQRLTVGLLAATLTAMTVLPALAGGPDRNQHHSAERHEQDVSAEGKRRGKKIVKKSFANNAPIAIPAVGSVNDLGPADPYPSTIRVSGFKKARILDVNLTLRGFSHGFPADVAVLLVAPGGRNALVMADVGNPVGDEAVTNLTLTLDDEAAEALPEDELLTSGSFRPLDGDLPGPNGQLTAFPAPAPTPSGSDALFAFDGSNPNGQWQLFVLDDDPADTGSLDGWTLQITAKSKTKRR